MNINSLKQVLPVLFLVVNKISLFCQGLYNEQSINKNLPFCSFKRSFDLIAMHTYPYCMIRAASFLGSSTSRKFQWLCLKKIAENYLTQL